MTARLVWVSMPNLPEPAHRAAVREAATLGAVRGVTPGIEGIGLSLLVVTTNEARLKDHLAQTLDTAVS